MNTPPFIAIEGIDGTGKSTQIQLLADWLMSLGRPVVTCVDPGGTELGAELRALLLGRRHEMTLLTEAFLFMASRIELVEQIIRPSLTGGAWVVSDRFLLSNIVYQGHAGGLDVEEMWRLGRLATGGLEPDLTIVLDLPLPLAAARRKSNSDRVEQRGGDYFERVRQGFLTEARRRPGRLVVINAEPPIEMVHQRIRSALTPWLTEVSCPGVPSTDTGPSSSA